MEWALSRITLWVVSRVRNAIKRVSYPPDGMVGRRSNGKNKSGNEVTPTRTAGWGTMTVMVGAAIFCGSQDTALEVGMWKTRA